MTCDDLICPLQIEVLRNVPFVAKLDIQLEIGGKLIATGDPRYDGESEWVIYASFGHLACNIREGVIENIEMSLEEYLSKDAPNLSPNLQDIETRVAVTPLMIYKTAGSREMKLTSAARSYLDLCYDTQGNVCKKNGKAIFKWMPDVQRDRYRDMEWKKESSLSDFLLENEIEGS